MYHKLWCEFCEEMVETKVYVDMDGHKYLCYDCGNELNEQDTEPRFCKPLPEVKKKETQKEI